MTKTIYVDNAATTAMSDRAIEAMKPYLKEIYGNPSSLHGVGQRAKEELERARAAVAACLGVQRRSQGQEAPYIDQLRASRRAPHPEKA